MRIVRKKHDFDYVAVLLSTFKISGSHVVWRHTCLSRNGHYAGDIAGGINAKGYREVSFTVDGKRYFIHAHRVAWILTHKKLIAKGMHIDHKDGNRLNNRPSNLRAVSIATNARNRTHAVCTARTALMNINYEHSSWYARLCISGHRLKLGPFVTAYAACVSFWKLKFEKEPDMRKSWKPLREQQLELARSMDTKAAHKKQTTNKPTKVKARVKR